MRDLIRLAAVLMLGGPAVAQGALPEALPGAEIAAAVGGRTVQGSMVDSGAYSEFYDADGTIRGDGYTGEWTVAGDQMCFDYGEEPAVCLGVAVEGEALSWLDGDAVTGTGTLVEGNPNGF